MTELQRFVFRVGQPPVLAGKRLVVWARDVVEAEQKLRDARVDGHTIEGWHLDHVGQ
jgi:hypothetical protein